MAALEAAAMINLGMKIKLSEQQIVDCSGDYGNLGCKGGYESSVFNFVIDNGGAALSSTYGTYTQTANQCKNVDTVVTIDYFGKVARGDENDLKTKVAISPVCVNFDSRQAKSYAGGIYYNNQCNPFYRDHAVLAVGYGTENNVDYWLIRNR